MKNNFKTLFAAIAIFILAGCSDKEYTLGELTAPSNIVISALVVGQDPTHPDGDGSGDVVFTVTADNAITYKIDFDASNALDLVTINGQTITKKYTSLGVNTYTVTAVVYGRGGTSSTATQTVTVRSDFTASDDIVNALTGGSSKTWYVDKSIPAHFGVGPWNSSSIRPEWWAAQINEKEACCNCFYTARFTFTKSGSNYSLAVSTPDGAFTKTGGLTTLPGIPSSGAEACYAYGGGSSAFSFAPASSGAPLNPTDPANSPSTGTSIILSGNSTFIGYGAVQKEYEILAITPTAMYLRVQGTETANAWYLRLRTV